jgi:hypothetical protein
VVSSSQSVCRLRDTRYPKLHNYALIIGGCRDIVTVLRYIWPLECSGCVVYTCISKILVVRSRMSALDCRDIRYLTCISVVSAASQSCNDQRCSRNATWWRFGCANLQRVWCYLEWFIVCIKVASRGGRRSRLASLVLTIVIAIRQLCYSSLRWLSFGMCPAHSSHGRGCCRCFGVCWRGSLIKRPISFDIWKLFQKWINLHVTARSTIEYQLNHPLWWLFRYGRLLLMCQYVIHMIENSWLLPLVVILHVLVCCRFGSCFIASATRMLGGSGIEIIVASTIKTTRISAIYVSMSTAATIHVGPNYKNTVSITANHTLFLHSLYSLRYSILS